MFVPIAFSLWHTQKFNRRSSIRAQEIMADFICSEQCTITTHQYLQTKRDKINWIIVINPELRKAKTNYYKRYFETNIGNTKKSWKGVNSILGRTQPATEINRIDIGDNDVLFLDLKKASDTVDHSILLKKTATLWPQFTCSSVVQIIPVKSLSEYSCKWNLSSH